MHDIDFGLWAESANLLPVDWDSLGGLLTNHRDSLGTASLQYVNMTRVLERWAYLQRANVQKRHTRTTTP